MSKIQEAGRILRTCFFFSKRPHFDSVYFVALLVFGGLIFVLVLPAPYLIADIVCECCVLSRTPLGDAPLTSHVGWHVGVADVVRILPKSMIDSEMMTG